MTNLSETTTEIASLAGEILSDARDLVRQEAQLLRAEMILELRKVIISALGFGFSSIFALIGLVITSLGIAHFVAKEWPRAELWMSYLGLGAFYVGLAIVGYMVARTRAKTISLTPRRAVESVKETAEWAVKH